jgi:membrane fusion protein (multidrug efflux system)
MNQNNHKKTKVIFAVGLVILCIAGAAGYYIVHGAKHVSTDDAYIIGRIHSIASKVPGTAQTVFVDDNQAVKKGDRLVAIDPVDYQLKVSEARAALNAARARLTDAAANIRTQSANLEIQRVSLHQATQDLARADKLFQEGVVTQERHEKVTTAYNLAATQVKAAQEQVERAKALEGLERSLIKQARATLEIAKRNLSYTTVSAPSDGYVTGKSVEVGNQIQAGQPLMAVVALDDIWIVANFKETQLKNVRPGQRVKIKVDTYPGKVFTGRVDSIMAGTGAVFSLFPPENALGNYVKVVQRIPVKIVFDADTDTRHILRIGMSCIPTITTGNE